MKNILARATLLTMLVMTWTTLSHAAPLPPNHTLSIQLSAVDYAGQIIPVDSTTAQTDAQGRFTFSFPGVPSTGRAQYLYLQVFDGANMLRQSLVPAPDNGGTTDAGISEVSSLQTRILMSSGTSGISPFRMVAALTMLRTTAIPADDASKIGTAIGAASDAFYAALYTGGATSDQLAVFNRELLAGLRRTMALYRQSVDVATVSDLSIEARGRYQAIAQMMRELLSASSAAGIPLAITDWAFAAAGGAAQTSIEQQNSTPAVISLVRLCFVNQMNVLQAVRATKERIDALTSLGYSAISLPKYFGIFNALPDKMINAQKGIETDLANQVLSSAQTYETAIFNSFAIRDIVYMHTGMEYFSVPTAFDVLDTTEYDNLLAIVIARMASIDVVMSAMMKDSQSIYGGTTTFPIWWLSIPLWAYIQPTTALSYPPIPDLALQVSTPPAPPVISQLSGSYKALAELQYDVSLTQYLIREDSYAVESVYPTRFMPLSAVATLKHSAQQRVAAVTSRISGITDTEKRAFIPMMSGVAGIDFL